jgi:predicted transcriptional regulator
MIGAGHERGMRMTYRTRRVLSTIAAKPGASSREIAEGAGIEDQGQISKLLARLAGFELIENTAVGRGKGQTKAWRLTEAGVELERAIRSGVEVSAHE